jgi:hypothetical protein
LILTKQANMATFSLDTVENIYTTFNDKAIKIVGTPNIETLRALRNQLKSNAANLQSNLGGGNHGDLGLILSDLAYAIIAPGTPYVRPANPGQIPNFPDNGGTAAQIAAIERVHRVECFEFNRYKNVEAALKRFLLHSIDDIYVHALYQLHVGYANRTTRELLDHLFTSYGRVHPDDLVANTKAMQKPWDPNTPFEILAKQIDDCADFADAAGQPYTPAQILTQAYSLVFSTGLYERQLDEWDSKAAADKNWDRFKSFFLVAQTNLMFSRRATAGRQGYGHMALGIVPPPNTDKENDIAEALALLATSADADRSAFATITSSNQQLTKQLADAMQRLATMETKIDHPSGRGNPSGNQNSGRVERPYNKNYCWTHGYFVGQKHTSATCNTKADGHKDEATRAQPMGGSTRSKHLVQDFQ